jgi:hypothetical protein
MTALPNAEELITAARTAMNKIHRRDPDEQATARLKAGSKALDRWAPDIDQLTDLKGAAAFLGYTGGAPTITRMRQRTRVDGTPEWPEPDARFGRSDAWRYRTIVLSRASAPGHGHPGLPRRNGRVVPAARKDTNAVRT